MLTINYCGGTSQQSPGERRETGGQVAGAGQGQHLEPAGRDHLYWAGVGRLLGGSLHPAQRY